MSLCPKGAQAPQRRIDAVIEAGFFRNPAPPVVSIPKAVGEAKKEVNDAENALEEIKQLNPEMDTTDAEFRVATAYANLAKAMREEMDQD